jgi:hypothetical protein
VFSKALAQAEQYTLPVIFTRAHRNGQISSGLGTCIVLNQDGWILTAAHLALEIAAQATHQTEAAAHDKQVADIINDPRLHQNDKRKRLRLLKENPFWITHQAALWGLTHKTVVQRFHSNAYADVAIGRLEPFDPAWIATYPIFKNPAEPMLPGTSLCRLGFPFHQINATFDRQTGEFRLGEGVLPVPRFPNDGIHTRVVNMVSTDGKHHATFLETSTPGLKGQSGGPILDRDAHIWAMQSKTQSLPLGFAPEAIQGNRKIVEHQFMHVGWGSHVSEIIALCNKYGVVITLSS